VPVRSLDKGRQRSFSDIAASPQGVRPLSARREAGGQRFGQSDVFQTGFRETLMKGWAFHIAVLIMLATYCHSNVSKRTATVMLATYCHSNVSNVLPQ
jgi:hypothetical protein